MRPSDTKQRLVFTQFEPRYQDATRALILDGLAEHWGTLDPKLNQDLANIAETYRSEVFLLAWHNDRLVGTGALVREGDGVSRIMRMSVDKAYRRLGIGTLILEQLLEHARTQGHKKIVLETTATWADAIEFYKRAGFHPIEVRDGDLHFELDLYPG